MTDITHPHYQLYKTGACRCKECRADNARYELERKHIRERPDSNWDNPFVDSTECMEHLEFLSSKGISLTMIEEQTGICKASIQAIRSGRQKKVYKSTERVIMTLEDYDFDPETRDKRSITGWRKRRKTRKYGPFKRDFKKPL